MDVITVLQYLVIAAAIGLVVFFLAVIVFGRGEQMAPLSTRTSPAELPGGAVSGEHIRAVRFAVGVRGYRMGDVDWTLDRMADEVDRLRGEIRSLGGDPDRLRPDVAGELLAVPAGDAVHESDAFTGDQVHEKSLAHPRPADVGPGSEAVPTRHETDSTDGGSRPE